MPHPILFNLIYSIVLQGISYWSVKSNSALRGRSINHFIDLWFIVGSGGLEIWVSSTSFQKSDIDWPQQPLTLKVLVSNLIFHDSTPKHYFLKHQNKAVFNNLDDSEATSCDFSGLRTSAASMTSTASMASMTSTASFHQKIYWSWWLDHSWHQNDQYLSLFVELIIKNPIFH